MAMFPSCHIAPSRLTRMHTRRLVVAAVVVAALAAGCKPDSRPGGGSAGDPSAGPAAGPAGDPVELSILYGSEKKTWLDEQVKAFNASRPRTGGGRVIRVMAKPVGSGEATAAILGGSQHPVVYSPASGAYVTLLNQAWQSRDGHTRPIAPAGAAAPRCTTRRWPRSA